VASYILNNLQSSRDSLKVEILVGLIAIGVIGAVFIPLAFDPAGVGGIDFIDCEEEEIVVFINATWVCGVDQKNLTELEVSTFANENTDFRPHLVRGTNVDSPIKNFGEYSIRVMEFLPNEFGEVSWDYLVPEDYELGGDLAFTVYWFKEDGLTLGDEVDTYEEESTACLNFPTTGTPLTIIDNVEYDFEEGEEYLIMVSSAWGNDQNHEGVSSISVRHGTTDFEGSKLSNVIHKASPLPCAVDEDLYQYFWWGLWTPNATEATENLSLFVDNTDNNGLGAILTDDTTFTIIKLSDTHLANQHYFYNQNNINSTLANLWATPNDATLSFTPQNNTDWLILGTAQYVQSYADRSAQIRLLSNGTVVDTLPFITRQGEAQGLSPLTGLVNIELDMKSFARAFSLTGVPQTFDLQIQMEDGETNPNGDVRTSNTLLALNLDRFDEYAWVWTPDTLELAGGLYATEVDTVNITALTDQSKVLVLADIGVDQAPIKLRTQIDNSDVLPDETFQEYNFQDDISNTDITRWGRTAMENSVTNGTHFIDVDGSDNGGKGAQFVTQRSLVGIVMSGNTTGIIPPTNGTDPSETVCFDLRLMSVDVGEDLSSSIVPTHGDWYESCATTVGGADLLRTITWTFNSTINPFEPEEVGIVQLKRHGDNSTSDDYSGKAFALFGELQWIVIP
jgi:hypothetical protein